MHSSLAQVAVSTMIRKQFQLVPRGKIGVDPENRNLTSFRSERDLDLIFLSAKSIRQTRLYEKLCPNDIFAGQDGASFDSI